MLCICYFSWSLTVLALQGNLFQKGVKHIGQGNVCTIREHLETSQVVTRDRDLRISKYEMPAVRGTNASITPRIKV